MIPGLMILQHLVERFQEEDITVSHYGVREGYIRKNPAYYVRNSFQSLGFR